MQYLLSPYNYDLSDPESIPNLLLTHLEIVGVTMLIALIIAIHVGLLVARYKRLYLPIITLADLLYSIPGVALIGVLIIVFPTGPASVLIPLVAYTQLALIRNIAAAVNNVDPLLIEVGHAMGMTRGQLFFRVTLPLALPVIIAGIRVATVTTIGIASLASLAGQGGLGDLVFNNLQPLDLNAVTAGGILMAALAILADLLLLGIQTALSRGRGAAVAVA